MHSIGGVFGTTDSVGERREPEFLWTCAFRRRRVVLYWLTANGFEIFRIPMREGVPRIPEQLPDSHDPSGAEPSLQLSRSMVRFVFAPPGSVHLRIAYSPLWECVISVRVLRDPERHTLFRSWIRRAASVVEPADLDLLDPLVRADGGYIPDFLAPPPVAPGPTFATELERLRSTPLDVLRTEIARAAEPHDNPGASRLLAAYTANPLALREAIADAVERYWKCAIAPDWPRIEALLEGEVLWRARTLALHGAGEVLRTLHPTVSNTSDAVHIASTQEGECRVDQDGLLLVPSVFSWPDVFTVHDEAWRASIYYPARGAGTLWEPLREERRRLRDPLALLAGSGRARVLRALAAPATTTELAVRLGASPASVSAHLQRLQRAGLLERTRIGRRVFYQTSATGRDLLHMLEVPPLAGP
jgi:DNA-binding transcriptional ArsR family regulator